MTARIRVRLTPRGGTDRIEAVVGGVLGVRVAASPVDGAANAALERLVARELGVPRTGVRIASGATARTKVLEVDGIDAAALARRWPGLA